MTVGASTGELIRSGSHAPGIRAEAFGLPTGTALRYERPDPALAPLLPGYAVLDSDAELFHRLNPGTCHWMLPSWAKIWIRLTAGPISVSIGNRRYDPIAGAVMYGVTSRAMPVVPRGGITVAVEVSPLGWARFVARPADAVRDRIVPLDELLAPALVADLVEALHGSDRDLGVRDALDAVFRRHLPPPQPAEAAVARVTAALVAPGVQDIAAAAAHAGLSVPALQRVCRRYFGFTPKLLMMRARFLRIIAGMLTSEEPIDHGAVPPGYHNVPHLLRDANRFLGMTPRRFVAQDMPYLRATLRARRLVLTAPTGPLDD